MTPVVWESEARRAGARRRPKGPQLKFRLKLKMERKQGGRAQGVRWRAQGTGHAALDDRFES